jgi:hypothetical protein
MQSTLLYLHGVYEDTKSKINILRKNFTHSCLKYLMNCTVLSILIGFFYWKLRIRIKNVDE